MPALHTASHLFGQDTLMFQRFLKLANFDPGALDGVYGPRTDDAANAFYETTRTIANNQGSFDARSERFIATVIPEVQRSARSFLQRCRDAGIDARIISGTRSYAEQDALFAQGRINVAGAWIVVSKAKVVTKARGGHSWHNFGLAFDIGIFQRGSHVANEIGPYKAASVHAANLPLGWGGNWTGDFKDPPHYQFDGGLTLNEVRNRFEKGVPLPTAVA